MLSIFRNNRFTTAIPLAIYLVLIHLSAFLGIVSPAEGDRGAGALYEICCGWSAAQPFWSAGVAVVLVFIQALLVNNLADEFRLQSDRSWLPALFFLVATAALPDFLFLSPPLVALTFVPIALRRIFKAYKMPNATGLVFDAALWIVVSSLFYPPAIFLLLAAYAGVNIMRSFNLREQTVFLSGILTPLFLVWLGYFWMDRGGEFWRIQFGSLFGFYQFAVDRDLRGIFKAILIAGLLLSVLLSYPSYFSRKLIQIQKCISTLYWFLFVGILVMFLQETLFPTHLLLIMPSLGIFLAMSFAGMRNRLIAEIFHLALLGFLLFIQYFPA